MKNFFKKYKKIIPFISGIAFSMSLRFFLSYFFGITIPSDFESALSYYRILYIAIMVMFSMLVSLILNKFLK
jgi:hypothetical protein